MPTIDEQIVSFIRAAKQGCVVRSPGYSPAFLSRDYINDKTDAGLCDFMVGEVKNLDGVRKLVEAGAFVSIFIVHRETYAAMHLQVGNTAHGLTWNIIR